MGAGSVRNPYPNMNSTLPGRTLISKLTPAWTNLTSWRGSLLKPMNQFLIPIFASNQRISIAQPWSSRAPGALALLCLALTAGAPPSARAVVLTYTNRTVDAWMTPTCWTPNTNWSTGTWRTNIVNTNLRLNIGAVASSSVVLTYNATMGYTTLDVSPTGGENRAVALGVISDTASGTLNITGGTLRCIQDPSGSVVIVGAGAGSTYAGTSILNVNGGTLDASGGEISVLARGNGSSVGTLNVASGTVLADMITFANLDNVNGTGTLNFNGGTTVVRTIKVIGNRAVNKIAAINLNGGVLQATTNSTVLIDGNSYVITNGTGSFTVNLLNNVGNTFQVPAGAATAITASMGGAGGFTKTGAGTLNLAQSNTFTGPILVSQGVLGLTTLPLAASSVTVSPGATLRVTDTNSSTLTLAPVGLTNATIEFNYGAFNGYTTTVLNVANLTLAGTVTVNILGNSFPVTDLTLLTYGAKTGGGAFALGTIPAGSAATLQDTGSALVLHITAPSLQTLVWSGGDGLWQTGGGLDWNSGTATYLEYPSGTGELVTFDDSSAGTVNIPAVVKPAGVTVDVTGSYYTFSGAGKISGPTGLNKLGSSTLTIGTANDYTGITTVTGGSGTVGGTLYVDNPKALGSTAGGTVVDGPANTIELGTPGGNAITVTGETITISGTGVGGARGALRGAATATGSNVWAGPVILGATGARIGTEDNGNLTVSGTITDNGQGFIPVLRPGSSGILTITGAGNSWGGRTDCYGATGGKIVLGLENALPTNAILNVGECVVDLNGYAQSAAGLAFNGGAAPNAILLNNGASPATLTLNPTANQSFPGNLQDGTAPLALVKAGTNSQTLTGVNTYTGPTVVNGGGLAVTLPMSSSALTLADSTRLAVTVAGSTWSPAILNMTNATLSLNFGTVAGVPGTVFTAATLNVSGSNVVNIAGVGLPNSPITLAAYTAKNGAGTFSLGTLPAGMQATIADTGSAIVLNITFSPMSLTWSGVTTATWNTNGTFDWNFGAAFYQEYGPLANGLGDTVTFDDSAAAFTVSRTTDVHPFSITVTNSANAYSIGGPGRIGGPTGLTKLGTNVLALDGVNDFTGGTILSAGILSFGSGSLGASNVTLIGNSTLQWANANSQDLSGRLYLSNNVVGTIDLQTNNVTWTNGGILSDLAATTAGQLTRIGAGKLTIAGNYFLGSITRFNAGTTEVAGGSLWVTNGGGTANLALVVDNANLAISGGGTLNVGDRLAIASIDNSIATLTLSSGALTVDDSGSATTTRGLRISGNTFSRTNMSATCSLNGGTLTTSRIFVGIGTGTSVFNFNGGTLQPSASPFTNFMNGLTHAYVQAGGAVIDSRGLDFTIAQTLEHDPGVATDGGLAKLGGGTVTLAGTNTYNGATTIGGGVLLVNGALASTSVTVQGGGKLGGTGTLLGPVAVNSGGALAPGAAVLGTLNLSNTLTLSSGSTNFVRISLDGGSTNCDKVVGLSSVAYAGALVVTLAGTNDIPAGTVFKPYESVVAGTGNFSSVTVLPAGTASFDPANGELTFLGTAPPSLSWINTGTALQFSWSGNYKLQAQTNTLSVGLSTGWGDYPGGGSSPVSVPIELTQGCVFFRLVAP